MTPAEWLVFICGLVPDGCVGCGCYVEFCMCPDECMCDSCVVVMNALLHPVEQGT